MVYDELRQLASKKLAHEHPDQTLQTTALVHEAYLRVAGHKNPQRWRDQRHFFAAAAEAMRRILIENARRKKRLKHGGNLHRVDLPAGRSQPEMDSVDVIALDDALHKLAKKDPQAAEIVKLHFYAGLTIQNISIMMGISRATAERHWANAREWLRTELGGDPSLTSR